MPTTINTFEELSSPFLSQITFHSGEADLDLSTLVGKPYDFETQGPGNKKQLFSGHVGRAMVGETTVRSTAYTLELRPWLYFLNQGSACRIFQDKTVPEIVKKVANEAGYADLKKDLNQSYPKLEYVVQYNESDFNFVSRLLEEAGIFYYFTHTKGHTTLVLADSTQGYQSGPELKWIGNNFPKTPDACIWNTCLNQSVQPTMVQVDGYNYLTPTAKLTAKCGQGYPAKSTFNTGHLTQAEGENLATSSLSGFESYSQQLTAQSSHSSLKVGMTFNIKGCPRSELNKKWLVTSLEGSFAEGGDCLLNIKAIPGDKIFRPHKRHFHPPINGPLTAVVCGKAGEKIWTDEHGRVKVRFHFDHKTVADEKASAWLRVAQGWGGEGHGSWFFPRVGDEVLINFIGGDPSCPIIVGSVYNAAAKPPWPLPTKNTVSGFKSQTIPEGSGGHEISFDDKEGEERLYFHAQKLMEILAEDQRQVTVIGEGGDSLTLEKGNHTILIKKGNTSLTLDEGNRLVELKKGGDTLKVEGDRTIEVGKGEKHTVKKNSELVIDGNYTITIKGELTINAKNIKLDATQSLNAKSGAALEIAAGTSLKAKSGTEANIKSGTGLVLAGGTTFKLSSSAKGEVNGGAMLDLKGGLVKLN